MAIDAERLRDRWDHLRDKVKERWGELTDDDVALHGADVERLVGAIQRRTGEGREAIEQFLDELASEGASATAEAAEHLRAGYDRAARGVRDGYGRAEGLVRSRPVPSLTAAFGLGLAAGVVLGLALHPRR
jgi:uncharacterized protein YjbJ (UPF0337 family)